jgi:PAS domain S-box-containing protein
VSAPSRDPKGNLPPASEAEETIDAIHRGRVDAIVVQGPAGPQIVMLHGADLPYRVLVERMSDGALTFGPDGRILYANRRLADLTGIAVEQLVGRDFAGLFVGDAPSLRENAVIEARLKRHGETLPVSVWTSAIAIGGVSATLVTVTDLSVHVRAEEVAIAERFARSILEQATDAMLVLGPDGRITHASWVAEQLATEAPVGRMFSDAFPVDAQGETHAGTLARFSHESLDAMLATKPLHGVEVALRNPRLGNRFFLLSAGPLVNDVGRPVGSIVTLTEITERKRAEERQKVLVAELNHRVKNILAIVQAVAGQTVRTSPSLAAFDTTFAGRIQALSIAHDILTRTRWIGIGLKELLAAVLAPYRSADERRVRLEGPPVLLPARAVVPLSITFHELATNASKYGALLQPTGTVNVEWNVVHNGASRVEIVWSEAGGPEIQSGGKQSGFGTTLIRRVIEYDLEGNVELAFEPEGVRGVMTFPLKASANLNDLAGAQAS